jgi:O-antigen ligase
MMLPLTLMIFLRSSDKKLKAVSVLANITGLWALMASGSRISFGGFVLAMALIFIVEAIIRGKTVRQKIWWWLKYQVPYGIIVLAITLMFGQGMIDRFSHFFEGIDIVLMEHAPGFRQTMHDLNGARKRLPEMLGIRPPDDGVGVDDAFFDPVLTPSDARPEPVLPGDVFEDIPDVIWEATEGADGEVTYIRVYVPRTWSENAERFGLSMAIRLDTLWPYAFNAWRRSPLLGSSYGNINKGENFILFTEADSVDNNFLRTLGERGLIGFVLFYGMIVVALVVAIKHFRDKDWMISSLAMTYFAIVIGLAVNALLIDVFAASKVAFMFWAMTGLLYAAITFSKDKNSKSKLIDQAHDIVKVEVKVKKTSKKKPKTKAKSKIKKTKKDAKKD